MAVCSIGRRTRRAYRTDFTEPAFILLCKYKYIMFVWHQRHRRSGCADRGAIRKAKTSCLYEYVVLRLVRDLPAPERDSAANLLPKSPNGGLTRSSEPESSTKSCFCLVILLSDLDYTLEISLQLDSKIEVASNTKADLASDSKKSHRFTCHAASCKTDESYPPSFSAVDISALSRLSKCIS